MQTASSTIWTRVAESISYDDNHNTTVSSIGRGWHKVSSNLSLKLQTLCQLDEIYKTNQERHMETWVS